MDKAIQITDLCKKYKNGRGIENVGFCVDRGEIFGFLGPNGAGKTTAMKIITGLIKADSGKAMINGYDVAEEYENAMKSVGTIIEAVALGNTKLNDISQKALIEDTSKTSVYLKNLIELGIVEREFSVDAKIKELRLAFEYQLKKQLAYPEEGEL